MSVFDLLVVDAISVLYKQYTNEKNKQKIDEMTCGVFGMFMDKIKPYFLLLTILLLLLIILNIVQFYYFMRTFLKSVDLKEQAGTIKEILGT
jgi:hypothetical protein